MEFVNPPDQPAGRQRRLEIVYRPIDEQKPDPQTAHRHSAKKITQLGGSISAFGFCSPALVDENGNVIAGHARILACKKLGWTEIPTIPVEGLSEHKRRALMLADNKLTENATWDDRLLAEQLKELSLAELDFSLDVIGFEMGEIDFRIASLDGKPVGPDPADTEVEPASGPPVSKPGDLWLVGDHRVLCGNVLNPAALQLLMGEQRAAMVFTDPPYNVPIDGHCTGLGNIRHRSFTMAAGEMSLPTFSMFLERSLGNQATFSQNGAWQNGENRRPRRRRSPRPPARRRAPPATP